MTAQVVATPRSDAERAVAVVSLAFIADPIVRWTYPDPDRYLGHFPALVRAFGGRAFASGTAFHVGPFSGAAF